MGWSPEQIDSASIHRSISQSILPSPVTKILRWINSSIWGNNSSGSGWEIPPLWVGDHGDLWVHGHFQGYKTDLERFINQSASLTTWSLPFQHPDKGEELFQCSTMRAKPAPASKVWPQVHPPLQYLGRVLPRGAQMSVGTHSLVCGPPLHFAIGHTHNPSNADAM